MYTRTLLHLLQQCNFHKLSTFLSLEELQLGTELVISKGMSYQKKKKKKRESLDLRKKKSFL